MSPVPASCIAPVVHVFSLLVLLAVKDPLLSGVRPVTEPSVPDVALLYRYVSVFPAAETLSAMPAMPFASEAVILNLMNFETDPPSVLFVVSEVMSVPAASVGPYEPPTAVIAGAVLSEVYVTTALLSAAVPDLYLIYGRESR